MSVTVTIRPDEYNPKTITIPQVAELMGLEYGASDNHYCLEKGQLGDFVVIYDGKKIGRGFEIWLEDNSVNLRMPVPTTNHDIDVFYALVEKVCQYFGVYFYECEGEILPVTELYSYIDYDKENSMEAIRQIKRSLSKDPTKYMIFFGALHPIFLGENELREIGNTLEGFDNLLDRLQKIDAYYATPRYFKRINGTTIFGTYFIGEEIVTTIPVNPQSPFNKMDGLDSHYVHLPDENDIPYEDFINNVPVAEYYDAGHITVKLSENDIQFFAENFAVNTTTKKKTKGVYWGQTLDFGPHHSKKVQYLNLPLDEINGYNHMAVFLRWANEKNLLSNKLINLCPELLNKDVDYRVIIKERHVFGGALRSFHFKEEAQPFVKSFYTFRSKGYPNCVDEYAEKYFGSEKYNSEEFKDEAYLFVPYNEEYYKGLSQYIVDAFEKYNNI